MPAEGARLCRHLVTRAPIPDDRLAPKWPFPAAPPLLPQSGSSEILRDEALARDQIVRIVVARTGREPVWATARTVGDDDD